MKIISHNMKPEELRSFDIYSTDDSGLFDSVPYMHSVESTKQEQEEADSEDYDSFDEWLNFVSGSDDFIHLGDEDEYVEFVVLPKDELIMYMWLDGGPSTSKIERVLKDFVGGKMVEVPAKPGWFEGAVRNFPPFNDDEHKTYVCMNGKYYTYPSELEKKGVEESRRPSRRGRMLKESDSGCVKPVYFEVYDYNMETGEDEIGIEIPEEIEDALLGSSYDSVNEMAADVAKKLDDCGFADMTNYEVMEKDDDTEVLITFGLAKGWERNVIVQYETC